MIICWIVDLYTKHRDGINKSTNVEMLGCNNGNKSFDHQFHMLYIKKTEVILLYT